MYGSTGQMGRRSGVWTVFGMLLVFRTIERDKINQRVKKDLKPDPKK